MSKWKIWETMKTFGSSTDDDVTPEDIRAAQAMIDEIELPDGLSEKILAAMTERRAENEANRKKKFNVQKIQGICQKPSMRVAAVAAVLALAMGFSPLRSYAAAALRNATKSTHDWTQDLSVENEEKSSHDFHASVIEHRIANDTLYLGMQVYWDGETREKLKASFTLPDYSYFSIWDYSFKRYQGNQFEMHTTVGYFDLFLNGEITDSEGNTLTFDTQDITLDDSGYWSIYSIRKELEALEDKINSEDEDPETIEAADDMRQGLYEKYRSIEGTYHYFEIYIPGLSQLIDSYDKDYTCQLTFSSTGYLSTEEENVNETVASESITFQFPIDSIDSVVTTEQHAINKTYTVEGTKITLKTLTIGQTEDNITFDLTPSKNLTKAIKENYDNGVTDKVWVDMDICLVPSDDSPIFTYDENGNTIMADETNLYRFYGDVLMDKNGKTTYSGMMSTKDYYGNNFISQLPKNAVFKIVSLSCGCADEQFRCSLLNSDVASTVYKRLKKQGIKLESNEINQTTVKAGKFTMDISAQKSDSASFDIDDIAYNKQSLLEEIPDYSEEYYNDINGKYYIDNSVRLLEYAFVYEGNGEIRDYNHECFSLDYNSYRDYDSYRVSVLDYTHYEKYDDGYYYTDDLDPNVLTHGAIDYDALREYTDPLAEDARPTLYPPFAMPKEQVISPIYIKYRVKKKDKFTDYVYYNPNYIKINEVKKREKAHQKALDYFNSLPTFGVAD